MDGPISSRDLLLAWRRDAALSQSAAAAELGVSLRTLQGWEAGRAVQHPRLLSLALSALGLRRVERIERIDGPEDGSAQ